MLKVILFVCTLVNISSVTGHGTMHDPVARQTRWRYNNSAPINYDDTQLFCGGYNVQWYYNGGRCGFCGDNYQDRQPRAHEIGGKYGQGTIVKSYQQGGHLPVKVQITANHKGYFYFQLCNLDRNGKRESDSCFSASKLNFTNGLDYYYLPHANPGWFDVTLKIPSGLTCNHCVLQWTYVTGNNWGDCGNGSGALGCGPQEHFRGCSDIKIQ